MKDVGSSKTTDIPIHVSECGGSRDMVQGRLLMLTNRPFCCCLWCASVYIWLFLSDLCPFSLAAIWSLIIVCLSRLPLRWAQFFICPLMIRDAIDREVEAVDSGESWRLCSSILLAEKLNFNFKLFISCVAELSSCSSFFRTPLLTIFCCRLKFFCLSFCFPEYQLAKPSDSHRKEMLFGSLAKPGHPMGKFCWGELVNTTAGTHNTHNTKPPWGMFSKNKQERWDSCQVYFSCWYSCIFKPFPTLCYSSTELIAHLWHTRKCPDTEARAKEEEDQCL